MFTSVSLSRTVIVCAVAERIDEEKATWPGPPMYLSDVPPQSIVAPPM